MRLAELCAGRESAAGDRRRLHPQGRTAAAAAQSAPAIHLLALNRDEAAILAGGKVQSDADLRRAARVLHQMNVRYVLIGLSDRGTFASSAGSGDGLRVPPFPAALSDVTGGGDAAMAGAIFGLLDQQSLAEAARWGQAAAALTVSVPDP